MQKFFLLILICLAACHSNNKVYLCNGHYSEVYHKTDHCFGLRNCSTEIEAVDIATAKEKHRRECRVCFPK